MKSPIAIGALIACTSVFTTLPLLAAETRSWPWKDTAPVDPALALLQKVDSLKAAITDLTPPSLSISVDAMAPTPGFTELKLTPRLGDPNDLIFAFDVRGRPPQDLTTQIETPVTIDVAYQDAPLASVGIVEVYAKDNCKAFSLKDKTEVECSMNPGSQQAP
ncbi:hypothetical protein AUC69_14560 [Methyloceanibacter superfactus]|uniref:Uncharacterized protein n=1 Tax=Methyloceanibacter superfactus TaxID=1774969 RepID=A0A1E3VTV7_9HYPH|nr:hypothetical protein [Methyloceanibacter superfactus]ODR96386.1 hypothetical protein AUC69_14560 [Methyloceanibacter superfactus]